MRLIDADALLKEVEFRRSDSGESVLSVTEREIQAAPTIEPTAPDRVLASDVVEGVRVFDDAGSLIFRVRVTGESYTCISDSENGADLASLTTPMVADMLQGCLERGERVDWPDGSPGCRFRKAEAEPPTLLEVAERVVASFEKADTIEHSLFEVSDLKEAIEREKAKQVPNDR